MQTPLTTLPAPFTARRKMPTPFTTKGIVSIEGTLILARAVLIALAILLPIALFITFTSIAIDTSRIEADLLAYRLLISPSGLGFFDTQLQSGTQGIIDAGKWEQATKNPSILASYARYPDNRYAVKITIGPSSAYLNKGLYEDYAVLANTRLRGPGGADLYLQTVPVILRHPEKDIPATAIIEVIRAR